jgi:hypothetical protein
MGHAFGYGDLHRYFYPLRFYAASCIKTGIFPFWLPNLFSGYPCFSALQLCVLYPVSVISYILPFFYGLNIYIIIHFILAGFFMYLLLREWQCRFVSALISGLSYAFGGYILSVVDMLTTLSSAIWTPLIYLLYTRALTTNSWKYIILTGIILGIQLLGGAPSVWYMVSISLFIFSILQLYKPVKITTINPVYVFVLSFLISIAFFLPQILPFLEMVCHSTRIDGLELSHASSLSLKPYEIFNFICPFFTGNYIDKNHFWFGQSWLESIYIGVLPFLFAICTMINSVKNNNTIIRFWSIGVLIAIIIAFGELFLVYTILYKYIPGFDLIRYPVKFFGLAAFGLSILAGLGYEIMSRKIKIVVISTGIFTIIYTIVLLIGYIFQYRIVTWIAENWHIHTPVKKLFVWYNSVLEYATTVEIILIISLCSMILYFKRLLKYHSFSLIIVMIIIMDLFFAGIDINPTFDKSLYTKLPETASIITQDKDYFRIYMEPKTEKYYRIIRGDTLKEALKNVQHALVPNSTLFYGIFDVWGYESLNLKDYAEVINLLNTYGKLQLINMLNIKYIISRYQLQNPKLPMIYDKGIYIYINPNYLPRAFWVPECMVIKDRQKILKRLNSDDFEPTQMVILEEIPEELKINTAVTKTKDKDAQIVKIVTYKPNKVVISTNTTCDGFLFLSDTYYPGWYAWIDGKPVKIYRANYAFRATYLNSGIHTVEFRYIPDSFKTGCYASIVAVLCCIIAISIKRRISHV